MTHTWFDRSLLGVIRKMAGNVPVQIELGAAESPTHSVSRVPVVRIRNRSALLALLHNPAISFGELYSQGDLEVEGDLVRLLEELYRIPPGIAARIGFPLFWMDEHQQPA